MLYSAWGQSGPEWPKITELGAVDAWFLRIFLEVCTRRQLGNGVVSIPPRSVPRGAFWEA